MEFEENLDFFCVRLEMPFLGKSAPKIQIFLFKLNLICSIMWINKIDGEINVIWVTLVIPLLDRFGLESQNAYFKVKCGT